ncbi:MAG: family 10 glycosylhydrolase [Pirellulales bacterium]
MKPIVYALVSFALGLDAFGFASAQAQVDSETWNRMRSEARHRPRKLIVDNDGNDAMSMTERTEQNFLAQRTSGLANTSVQSLFYCANATFGMSTRSSSVWQERNWKDERVEITKGYNVQELKEVGLDSLKMVCEFAKRNGIEVFTSIRMNDVHDHSPNTYGPAFFRNNHFKNQHPNWLLSTADKKSKTAAWSAVDYTIPEVREHLFRYVEEATKNYDLDGVSLDFFRHPAFFKTTFRGKPTTDQERAEMTALVQRIRQHLDRVGMERARPILLSIRVPDSLDYCRAIGLDVETWLENQWIDLILVSGYFQLNDWGYSEKLGRRFNVPVYASLDEPRVKDAEGLALRKDDATYRGRVSAVLDAGLDGAALFNFFDPHSPLMHQLGKPEELARHSQRWFAAARSPVNANGGNLPYASFQTFETLNPDHPKNLAPNVPIAANIRLPKKRDSDYRHLRIRLSRPIPVDDLEVRFGTKLLSQGKTDGVWVQWDISDQNASGLIEVQVIYRPKKLESPMPKLQWKDLYVESSSDRP